MVNRLMTRRAIVSCKNLRLLHILRISNCFEINVNVLNMVSWFLFNSGILQRFWYWFFKVVRISTMFMEFYSMEKKYCSTLLERDTSSFSQAIFVTYEHVLMMIVLLITMTGYYFDILSTQRSKIDRQYSLDQGEDRWLYYYMEFFRTINSCQGTEFKDLLLKIVFW